MNGRQLGAIIGAVGGLVFVLVNSGDLPGALLLRALGVAGFVFVVGHALLRVPPAPPQPSSRALRTYSLCLVAEFAAIPIGAALLNRWSHAELVPVWVVLVVGLHFVPFAGAFRLPLFGWLGLTLVAIALVGGGAALSGVDDAELWAPVVAGFVLLWFSYAGLRASADAPAPA